jgi:hypothetical protein
MSHGPSIPCLNLFISSVVKAACRQESALAFAFRSAGVSPGAQPSRAAPEFASSTIETRGVPDPFAV